MENLKSSDSTTITTTKINKMEQTAVEWLKEDLRIEFNFAFSDNILQRAKEIERQQQDEFAIGFAEWLSMNCTQSNSKDAWWIYKLDWKTTDELLEIYKQQLTK